MTFTLSLATEADIPGLIAVWNSAFWQPEVQAVFPDTPTGREWRAKSFEQSMKSPSQHCMQMIITEDLDDGKRKVVAMGRYFRYAEGEFDDDWRARWEPNLAEDMMEEMVGNAFFNPMARQHRAAVGERAHWFLEVLATDKEYQKKGLGSRLLDWGCEKADSEGLEMYLDAGKSAQPLYEKFEYVEQTSAKDPKAGSAPMLRPAKKEER